MKQRLLSVLLILCLLMGTIPQLVPTASAATYSGECGDNLTWTLDTETGVLRISGTGDMPNWGYYNPAPWYSYSSYIRSAEIASGVTSIGDLAFYECTSLSSVTIGNSVNYIGSDAFRRCESLTSIGIPISVTEIEDGAFAYCESLTSIVIPDSVYYIGHGVFEGCSGLTSVTLSKSITSIGHLLFSECTSLISVTIPDGVYDIADSAFENCLSLTSVRIGANVTYIGAYVFRNCISLVDIQIDPANEYFSSDENGVLYNKDATVLIHYPGEKYKSVNIPDSVTTIGDRAFERCDYVSFVTIPDSVTTIGDDAFGACYNLTSVTIPDSVTSIGHSAFSLCERLTSVTLPSSLTHLGEFVFYGSGLTTVTIPDSMTYISDLTFGCCYDLTFATVPASVSYIGEEAFRRCDSLEEIYILNPDCEIYDNEETIEPGPTGVIFGYAGSTAEQYAQNHGYTFRPLPCRCEVSSHEHTVEYVVPTCLDGGHYLVCKECDCSHLISSAPAATAHNYKATSTVKPTCVWTGLNQYTCTICGETRVEVFPATGHSYDDGAITTPPTCISKGIRTYTCTVCGSTKVESIPVTEHQHLLYCNNGADHSAKCITCPNSYNEPHRFVEGRCVCGAVERILDETIRIYHSLNLASDIAVNYAVKAAELEGYESYYMECILPIYDGNTLLGAETVTLQPELQGDFYYFTLNGLTALEMNNMVEATLHMTKDGKHYITNTDSYSIATYAYAQLNNEAMPEALRILCANLLRYGAKAQLWKGYRTDALADGAMTEAHKELLKDLDSVEFGYNSQILTDIENPVITWVGKTMRLDSKIVVRFVMNTTNYTGDLENLSLRVSFVNINGETETATLTNCVVYNAERNYYAFDFDGLLSAELRCVLNAAVYEGDTQLSPTMVYSVDTYGTSTTGDLRTLVQGMIAYGDSAKDFFAN